MEPNYELPWIIFELNEQLYAISTEMVTGILQFPPLTPIANAPEIFLGVANVRGSVTPILDLKGMLKIKDIQNDTKNALTALNYKLGGIDDYLTEMRRCVEKKEKFAVSSDYFGDKINLDAFFQSSQTHSYLSKIKELQNKLEEYGNRVNSQPNCLDNAIACGKELTALINTTVHHITDQSKKMVISLSYDTTSNQTCMGFVVDSVKAVDALEVLDGESHGKFLFANSQLVGVAHNEKIKGEILIVNDREIIKTVDVYRDYMKREEEKQKRLKEQREAEEKANQKKENGEKPDKQKDQA